MSITIEVPADFEKQYRTLDTPEFTLERRFLEAFAVEEYRQGRLGVGSVGQLLGLSSRWTTIEFLSKHGVYPAYDENDLQQDLETLRRLDAPNSSDGAPK